MKKILQILIILIIEEFHGLIYTQTLSPEEIYKKVSNSVLVAYCLDDKGYLTSQGSAVVINDSGFVYTNFHLFNGGVKFRIEKNGEKIEDVKIIGTDPEKDILILKIDAGLFPPIKPANSDSVIVGETVYALGNPRSYSNTFSSGIITAIRNDEEDKNGRLIQFNASISHGSSGGALLNENGELIGITSSSFEKGQNLNFAIPVNGFLAVNTVDYYDTVQLGAIASLCTGYNKYKEGGYYKANENYNRYLRVFPDDAEVLMLSGRNYTDWSRYDSAIVQYNKALELQPENKTLYYDLGYAYSYKNDTLNALDNYNKALEIDSFYSSALLGRGILYDYVFHNYTKAVNDYTKAFNIKPGYNFILFYRGAALLKSGDTVKAKDDLNRSSDYDSDLPYTCFERGKIFADLNMHQEAITDFTQAIKLDPDNDEYYFSRAMEYSKESFHMKAVDDYLTSVKINPMLHTALSNLGYEYYHLKDYEQSILYFNKSIGVDKNEFDSYLGLSIVSFIKNEPSNCIKFVRSAANIRNEIKDGIDGINKLEKEGYYWSREEKEILKKVFKLAGYNYIEKGKKNNKHKPSQQKSPVTKITPEAKPK